MEYILAIGYVETAILQLKNRKKRITAQTLEKELDKVLKIDKKIIKAYVKVALNNIKHSANEITIKEIEEQIKVLKNLYTIDKIIEKANNL